MKKNEKINNGILNRVINGLNELANCDIDNFDINMDISRTIANLNIAEKAYVKTVQSLMKKHIKKGEDGELVSANGFFVFKSEKDKDEYQDSTEKLNEIIVNEDVCVLKASFLKDVKGIKASVLSKINELIVDDRKK